MELKNDTFVLDCYAEGYKVYARARALSPEVNYFEYMLCNSSGKWTPFNLEYSKINGIFWAILTPYPERPGSYMLCVHAVGNNNKTISGMQVPFNLPAEQESEQGTGEKGTSTLPVLIGLIVVGVILWKLISSTTGTASSTQSSASSLSSSR